MSVQGQPRVCLTSPDKDKGQEGVHSRCSFPQDSHFTSLGSLNLQRGMPGHPGPSLADTVSGGRQWLETSNPPAWTPPRGACKARPSGCGKRSTFSRCFQAAGGETI